MFDDASGKIALVHGESISFLLQTEIILVTLSSQIPASEGTAEKISRLQRDSPTTPREDSLENQRENILQAQYILKSEELCFYQRYSRVLLEFIENSIQWVL